MFKFVPLPFFLLFSLLSNAQPPSGYYNTTTGKSCAALKSALKIIVTNGHTPQPYDALYDQYKISDIKPRETGTGSANVIWDIYTDKPTTTDTYNFDPNNKCGNYSKEGDCYNREHTVPQSWFNSESIPGSDYLQIFPTDGFVNGKRANYVYGEVAGVTYTSSDGSKLGSSAVAGITGTVFEPIDEYKGDLARTFFYFVTRYQNEIPSWSSNTTAFSNDTFPSININYLKLMLQWNAQDPVSHKEADRNNASYDYQGNRNPFIDHPEYATLIWNSTCPGLGTLPVNIIYFTGKLSGNTITLNWQTGTEINVARYDIEKSFNGLSFSSRASVNANGTQHYTFTDNISAETGRDIYYRLKKIDKDGSFSFSEVFSVHVPLNQLFVVSPNPASGFIKVQFKETAAIYTASIQIIDLAGKIIIKEIFKTGGAPATIPVNRLNNGIYIVKMVVNGRQFLQKIIISR